MARPKSLDNELWALIEGCWCADPNNRPAMWEVLQALELLMPDAQKGTGKAKRATNAIGPASPKRMDRVFSAPPSAMRAVMAR